MTIRITRQNLDALRNAMTEVTSTWGNVSDAIDGWLEFQDSSPTSTVHDRTITRLAVLKAAANFLGLIDQTREEVKSDHVLVLADKWLAWVQQPESEED